MWRWINQRNEGPEISSDVGLKATQTPGNKNKLVSYKQQQQKELS